MNCTCRLIRNVAAVIGLLMVFGCTGKHLIVSDDNKQTLDGCSLLPNCVSSTTVVLYNGTSAFELLIPHEEAWPRIKEAISKKTRTEIVEFNDRYIHAKCTSLVFQFVDNLELLLHPEENRISVRSSSTIALFDFGVNRWRIHELRKQLEEMKIIRQ